jgi:hypothetical protein
VPAGQDADVRSTLATIRSLPGVATRAGLSEGDLCLAERALGCHLPTAIRALLAETNGLSVGHGALRLLGCGGPGSLDLVDFNHPWTWKVMYRAWYGALLDGFVVFGLFPQGNLLGCFTAAMQEPGNDAPYYMVAPPSLPMPADRPISDVVLGLPHLAGPPAADGLLAAILADVGPLTGSDVLVHSPVRYPHFSRDETDLTGSVVLPAIDALRTKAEIHRAIESLGSGDRITAVQLTTDATGRRRLQLQVDRAG